MEVTIGSSTHVTEHWQSYDGKKLVDAEEMSSMGNDNEAQFCDGLYPDIDLTDSCTIPFEIKYNDVDYIARFYNGIDAYGSSTMHLIDVYNSSTLKQITNLPKKLLKFIETSCGFRFNWK